MSRSFRNTVPIKQPDGEATLGIIIPCAGYSEKMKRYGPKSAIHITDTQTIIGRQLQIFHALFPYADVSVVLGYELYKVRDSIKHDVRFVENEAYAETNVVRSICLALRSLKTKSLLISYGDLVFNAESLKGLVGDISKMVIDSSPNSNSNEAGCNIVEDRVVSMAYGLNNHWSQIVYLAPRETEILRQLMFDKSNNMYIGLEMINYIIDNGGIIGIHENKKGRIVEVDSQSDLKEIRNIPHEDTY
jgi:choline kinase